MDWGNDILIASIAAIPGIIIALIALKKSPSEKQKTEAETQKVKAETEKIHAEVADRWAEHVAELQEEVKGLRMDISQVRRENEQYRKELAQRDAMIDDLRDWAERLVKQIETEFHGVPVKMKGKKVHGSD